MNTDTYTLTMNSEFVATITGTAAREAALMGKKALIFGDAWFNSCPNVIQWNKDLTYEKILEYPIYDKDKILDYFINEMERFSIPGCQNLSAQLTFRSYLDDEFEESELKGVVNLMKKSFNI